MMTWTFQGDACRLITNTSNTMQLSKPTKSYADLYHPYQRPNHSAQKQISISSAHRKLKSKKCNTSALALLLPYEKQPGSVSPVASSLLSQALHYCEKQTIQGRSRIIFINTYLSYFPVKAYLEGDFRESCHPNPYGPHRNPSFTQQRRETS